MKTAHPYIPNSAPDIQAKMMDEIGIKDIDELYADIPQPIRFAGKMDISALPCEYDLKRHMNRILAKNNSCEENLNFLGGGCWQHYVPAICDEINHRSEFLTAYAGEPFEDHGRFQALFEYASMMGELLDMDVVNVPTYDWSQAASTSIRMAARITGRDQALVADTLAPDRLSAIRNYCKSFVEIIMVKHCPDTGKMDLEDLKSKLSPEIAAVYFENPSYIGTIEDQGQTISDMAHANGALSLVGVDPISLGVLLPPSNYGADIVCGDIQPLGIHMQYGGGHAGFIATRDEEKFVMEYPSRLFGIEATAEEGEYGFGDVTFDRTSFGDRENAKEFIGTATALWGITAGVYLALLGPEGITQVGKTILQRSQYAAKKISQINGVRMPLEKGVHFKEFVVDFSPSGKIVKTINQGLLEKKIFGGMDISGLFPELGNAAMFCITEIHTKEDIDTLVQALDSVING